MIDNGEYLHQGGYVLGTFVCLFVLVYNYSRTNGNTSRSHGGIVVTHLAPTSEVDSLNPGPDVEKLTVSYQ